MKSDASLRAATPPPNVSEYELIGALAVERLPLMAPGVVFSVTLRVEEKDMTCNLFPLETVVYLLYPEMASCTLKLLSFSPRNLQKTCHYVSIL